jgi:hypothetical protein
MKTLTVRLPGPLVEEIDAESRHRGVSRSDVVRERLQRRPSGSRRPPAPLAGLADVIGSVDGLPEDLSQQKKRHLRATGYGRARSR